MRMYPSFREGGKVSQEKKRKEIPGRMNSEERKEMGRVEKRGKASDIVS